MNYSKIWDCPSSLAQIFPGNIEIILFQIVRNQSSFPK